MSQIHVLDKHTAELIAAGEVVERPASVVKELTENALDAGAKKIVVRIERGGISFIEIQDDGEGIAPEDMPTAFIRHATSKIKTGEDLEHIVTLGFRGEALASVAAVSKITLLSKTEKEDFAYEYHIEGGEEVSFEEAARPQGTTITVEDLFYNTPARMKFLKKDVSEGNYVSDVMVHMALSHPEVSVRFIRDGKEQFFTPGDGKLRSAISAALSRDFGKDLVEVDYEENGMHVTGFVTPPRAARASRSMQHFFVNNRYIKNRTMMAGLEASYRGMLMVGRFPGCVLNVDMPPEKVDVNVHPTKTEVRFSRENDIFECIYRGVRNTLMAPATMESRFNFHEQNHTQAKEAPNELKKSELTFTAPDTAVQPFAVKQPVNAPAQVCAPVRQEFAPVDIAFSPFAVPETTVLHSEAVSHYETNAPKQTLTTAPISIDVEAEEPVAMPKQTQSQQPFSMPMANEEAPKQTAFDVPADNPDALPPLRVVGEVFRTYIIAQRGEEMCFIDKHAAHERLLYEKIKKNYGNVSSQMLLVPITVTVSAEEKNGLLSHTEYLKNFGLEVEDFGGNAVLVRAVPTDIVPDSVEDLAIELGRKLSTGASTALSEKTEWVLHSMSCRAAIKAGDKNQEEEMLALAQQIIDGDAPAFCPHGRPVILKLTEKELEKQFGRLGSC